GGAHGYALVIPGFAGVKPLADATADRQDQRLDLVVLQHAVDAGTLDVQDLAADRQDRLRARLARRHGRTARRVALDDEQLALIGVATRAVLQLVWHTGTREAGLAPHDVARLLGRFTRLGGGDGLLDDSIGLGGVLEHPVRQARVGGLLHERPDGDVAELGLGLAFELRLAQLH